MNQRVRAARNRQICWLALIGGSAIANIVLGSAAVWQVTWLTFALAVFSETYGILCYIADVIRDKPRDGDPI